MYSLLIVDDEMHIARGIQLSVDWPALAIDRVEIAHNVRQAIKIFEAQQIDILICDIEMPEGDGFEMLAWKKEHSPSTQAIFLTCHAEFEYARKALQLGSLDYILKPVPREQLEEVVQKAIEAIVRDREQQEFKQVYKHYHQLWSSQKPLLIERFWLDLLSEKIPSNIEPIKERFKAIDYIHVDSTQYLPVIFHVHRWNKELTVREEQIMEYALRNVVEESLLAAGRTGHVVSLAGGFLLLVITVEWQMTGMEQLKLDCEAYIANCNKYLYCQLSCYIGQLTAIQHVKPGIDQLLKMDQRNVTATNRVFELSEYMGKPARNAVTIQPAQLQLWTELLLHGEKHRLLTEISAYLALWKQQEWLDRSMLHLFNQEFQQMVYRVLKQKGAATPPFAADATTPERTIAAIRSVIDIEGWALSLAEQLADYLAALEAKQTLADKVKLYIAQHLDQDFSRQDLADYLGLSPDYVVKLFRKETGMAISDFIVLERVETAKNMLCRTEISISEIALMIGYSNFSYFSKVFKKATDLSPLEYRKQFSAALSK